MVTTMKRVILLSGGIDSAILACRHAGEPDTICIFIHYGQPAFKEERIAAMKVATACNLPIQIIASNVGCNQMRTGAGTEGAREVPGRNLAFVSLATTYYPNSEIVLGCTYNDHEDYPDCRLEFVSALNQVLSLCTNAKVTAPLLKMTKKSLIEEAAKQGWNSILNLTWSCYQGKDGMPCGSCNSCIEVKKAYACPIFV